MGSITACLASNVRTLRKEKGWTQTELAEAAGISLMSVQGIESERKWVSPLTAKSLARAFGVTEAKLFENCFERAAWMGSGARAEGEKKKKTNQRKINRDQLEVDHIPDDIFLALATTCKRDEWRWEAVRWLIAGFERSHSN